MISINRSLFATASLAAMLASAAAFAAPVPINGGGSSLAFPTYIAEGTDLFMVNPAFIFSNAKAGSPQGSAPVTYFGAVGSGKGTTAFLTNDYTQLNGGSPGKYKLGSTIITVPAPVFASGTTVHYGASDAPLSAAQVAAYNTSPGLGATQGPLIQLPSFGTPITIPFNDGSVTALTLNDTDLCGVLSGKITNWSGTSAGVAAGPITVVFRADGSGTTNLLTNHLASVCTSSTSNVTFTATDYFAANFSTLPANFFPAKGSGGVQSTYISILTASTTPVSVTNFPVSTSSTTTILVSRTVNTTGEVAYIGPDYTKIAPNSPNTSSLVKVASLNNSHVAGSSYAPTPTNTTNALATSAAPPSGTPCAYNIVTCPGKTTTNPANPNNWVPLTPNPTAGYPIVGFTNLQVSQCYKNSTVKTGIKTFLQDEYNNNSSFSTDITNGGFVKVPNLLSATYVTAINNTFLSNNSGYKLDIGDTAVCTTGKGR